MENDPKKVKCRSKTEQKILLLPALPFYLNLYDTFLEGNKNTSVISISAWNGLKIYNLGMFLGIPLGLRDSNSPEVLCSIIKHINLFILLILAIYLDSTLCKNNPFSLKQEFLTLTLLTFGAR